MTNDIPSHTDGLPANGHSTECAPVRATSAWRRTLVGQWMVLLCSLAGLILFLLGIWWSHQHVTIGMEGRYVVTIPGPKRVVVPYTHGDPLAVRIAEAEPVDEGYRYDVRYIAYGPGRFNLREYFLSEEGEPSAKIPEMFVSVGALLAERESGQLLDALPTAIELPTRGRWELGLMWGLWGLLFIPLFLSGQLRRSQVEPVLPPPTIAERLHQLLKQAEQSALSVSQQADLEKLLLAFWSERLQRTETRLLETLEELRKHPLAGEQIRQVEKWLHSRTRSSDGHVAHTLLESFDELNVVSGSRGGSC